MESTSAPGRTLYRACTAHRYVYCILYVYAIVLYQDIGVLTDHDIHALHHPQNETATHRICIPEEFGMGRGMGG